MNPTLIISTLLEAVILTILTTPSAYSSTPNKTAHLAQITSTDYGYIAALSAFNDVIYFGPGIDGDIYSYSTATGERKVIGKVQMDFYSTSVTFNNTLYIGSQDFNLYAYSFDQTDFKQLVKVNSYVYGVTALSNKIYFGTLNGTLYEYNPGTGKNKNVTYIGRCINGMAALNDKLYFGSDDFNLYEFTPAKGQRKLIASTSAIIFDVTTLNNKIYFASDSQLYEYNTEKKTYRSVCKTSNFYGTASLVPFNNEIYLGPVVNGKVWKFSPAESTCAAASNIPTKTAIYALTTMNNKLYVGDDNGYIYEYYEDIDLEELISVNDLGELTSNSDSVILNELNFVNKEIDINLLEVVNKTKTSAMIKGKDNNNKYFGQKEVQFTFLNSGSNRVLDLDELMKKGIFFAHNNKNLENSMKEVLSVTKDSLNYSNISATLNNKAQTQSNQTIFLWSLLFDNVQNHTISFQTPAGSYTRGTSITNEFTKVLNVTAIDTNQDWKNLLGVWPFDHVDSNICSGKDTKATNSITLGTTWDLSIQNNGCQAMSEVEMPSETVTVPVNMRVNVTASLENETEEVSVNLKQDLSGEIIANILNIFNEELIFKISIKELMENLSQLSLLPAEITINKDESVTFQGKLIRTLKRDSSIIIKNTWENK